MINGRPRAAPGRIEWDRHCPVPRGRRPKEPERIDLETDRGYSGRWVGYFLQRPLPGRSYMELGLTFRNGQMTGEVRDWVGEFVIRAPTPRRWGRHWTQALHRPARRFHNGYNEGKGIWGVWEIVATDEYPLPRRLPHLAGGHGRPDRLAPDKKLNRRWSSPRNCLPTRWKFPPARESAATPICRVMKSRTATSSGRRCSRITSVRLVAGQPAEEVGVVEHPAAGSW